MGKGRLTAGPQEPGPGGQGASGPLELQPHHTAPSIPAHGFTLHLSSCNNVTGRDAGHVDQIDGTVSLNTEVWQQGESISPLNPICANITPAKSSPAPAPLPVSLGPTHRVTIFHWGTGLAAKTQASGELCEASGWQAAPGTRAQQGQDVKS